MKTEINLETGLLSVIRKIIFLLPDTKVKQVLGPILDQEDIVVMANNSSVLVRTAVVRVSTLLVCTHIVLALILSANVFDLVYTP